MSPVRVSARRVSVEVEAEIVTSHGEIVNEQGDERTAIRHGTACKSNIPEWAGEGVGIVGIVYLAWGFVRRHHVHDED